MRPAVKQPGCTFHQNRFITALNELWHNARIFLPNHLAWGWVWCLEGDHKLTLQFSVVFCYKLPICKSNWICITLSYQLTFPVYFIPSFCPNAVNCYPSATRWAFNRMRIILLGHFVFSSCPFSSLPNLSHFLVLRDTCDIASSSLRCGSPIDFRSRTWVVRFTAVF